MIGEIIGALLMLLSISILILFTVRDAIFDDVDDYLLDARYGDYDKLCISGSIEEHAIPDIKKIRNMLKNMIRFQYYRGGQLEIHIGYAKDCS